MKKLQRNRKTWWAAVTLTLLAASLAAGRTLWAQEMATPPIANTVLIGAEGQYEAEPDTVMVQFNISAQDEKLQEANQKASRSAEQVRQLLRSNGLDPKNAQIGRFSVQPVYDYKTPKRKLIGYRVDTNITIKMKDFSKVVPITQGLTDLDVSDTQSVSYLLDDIDAAKVQAIEDALHRAHDEAAAVARFSGRTLGQLSYTSVDVREPSPVVRPMMMSMNKEMGAAQSPAPTADFGTQKITVTAHVNALYILK